MNNKRIASEWLFFIGAMTFGLIIIPLLILPYLDAVSRGSTCPPSEFYERIFTLEPTFIISLEHDLVIRMPVWLVILGPYIFAQILRLTVWSVKQLKMEGGYSGEQTLDSESSQRVE